VKGAIHRHTWKLIMGGGDSFQHSAMSSTPYLLKVRIFTLYTCILYTYSHRKGGEGGRADQREGQRGNSSQS
jgi:hypothetical protein